MVSRLGLGSALDAAVRGVSLAHEKAASAADTIARAGVVTGPDTASISAEAARAAAGDEPDMVQGMLDLRVARYQQSANLAVIDTVHEMSREAARIGE